MKSNLKKIHTYGDEKTRVFIKIEVEYAYEGEMFTDAIRLNYDILKDDIFITVEVVNPGISLVVERFVDLLSDLNHQAENINNPLEEIIRRLKTRLDLQYNENTVGSVLSEVEKKLRENKIE